jgi:hypothetical protein
MIDSGFDINIDPTEEEQAVAHLRSHGFSFSRRKILHPKVNKLSDETLDHLHTLLTEAGYKICHERKV